MKLKFAWLPVRAWYHQEYKFVWRKWYRTNWHHKPNSLCWAEDANAVAEFES